MEPVEYIRALIRRWPIIAIIACLGAAMTFAGTDPKPAPIEITYSATNTLLVRDPSFGNQSRVGTINLNQIPTFATTGEVPSRVARALDYQGLPAALASRVSVQVDPITFTVTFTATGTDPADIVRLADTFSEVTVKYLTEKQQEDRSTRIEKIDLLVAKKRVALDEKEQALPPDEKDADPAALAERNAALSAYQSAIAQQIELSDVENSDINLTLQQSAQPVQLGGGGFTLPRTRKERVPLGAALGALLGAGLALVVERLDARIRDRRRAEESFGSSVLVEFPVLARRQRGRRILVGPQHHHAVAENFRSLRTSVMFMTTGGEQAGPHQQFGVIMITSPSPGEGKTTTALNLAAAFAETGRRVILVNADFRRPAIVKAVIAAGRPPLPGGLMALTRLPPSEFLVQTDVPGVELLDLAPLAASAGDLTRATVKMTAQLRHEADVVIVDTPPLAVTTEALEFVPISEVVILIGRIGSTTTEGAKRAAELVQFAGAKRIGIALTAAGATRIRGSRYYDYYSDPSSRSKRSQAKIDKVAEPVSAHRPAPTTSLGPATDVSTRATQSTDPFDVLDSVGGGLPTIANDPAHTDQPTAGNAAQLDPLMATARTRDPVHDIDVMLAELEAQAQPDNE